MARIVLKIDGEDLLDEEIDVPCDCSPIYEIDPGLAQDKSYRQDMLDALCIDSDTVRLAVPEICRILRKERRSDLAVRLEELIDQL